MKKLIKSFSIIFASLTLFSLTACSDVIFDEIRKEVELEDAQISGDVRSIVRYKYGGTEYLFVQNGNIFKKDMTDDTKDHGWVKTSKPDTGAKYSYVNKLAADENYLYAHVTRIKEDTDKGENISDGSELWYSDDAGDTWNKITINSNSKFTASEYVSLSLFCTNDVSEGSRYAYARVPEENEYKIYKLNGSSATSVDEGTYDSTTESNRNYSKTYNDVKSCVNFNGTTYFSPGYALAADGDYIFRSSGSYVWYSDNGSDWTKISESLTAVYSLAVTSDYLLIGTNEGLKHIKLDDTTGIPANSTSSFATNADSTLSSYYEVHTLLVEDPDESEYKGTRIYGTTTFADSSSSTSAQQENCGLWSYMPERNKWNRE